MNNQELLQKITIVAEDFNQLGDSWDLLQKSANYLDNKKEWYLTDWLILTFTSWNVITSAIKTVDDTKEVFNAFSQQPIVNRTNGSIYSTTDIYKILALRNPALGIAFGVSPFNGTQRENPIASLYIK